MSEQGWIDWNGGECPVRDALVDIRYRNGEVVFKNPARDWRGDLYRQQPCTPQNDNWIHDGGSWDIVAYRVVVANHSSADSRLSATLAERGNRYGEFAGQANASQGLKAVMALTPNWKNLSYDKREALEMIQHKIARILNGDPDYRDSWIDLAGYATLVADRLEVAE